MKYLSIFAILFAMSFGASAAAVNTYDFAAQGNYQEYGYGLFDTSVATHALNGGNLDSGLQVSASNGYQLQNVAGFPAGTGYNYNAYIDGRSGGQDAGLGVCKTLTTGGQCTPSNDDNQVAGEYIHMVFGAATEILSLDFTGNHTAVSAGTELVYTLDSGLIWNTLAIGGETIGNFMTLNLLAINGTFDYTVNNGELYLAGMTTGVSAVPVPAAFWLFGTALIGFAGMGRRVTV